MKDNETVDRAEAADRIAPHHQLRSGLERFAWLSVPLLLAAIIAARAAGLSESYENEALRLVLSFTFYTLVSLGTLFLLGRSFLRSGSPGVLLLECGVVLWSLAGTVGDLVDHGDANINVTIFNSGILLAALCHLAGAVLALRPQGSLRAKPLWLGAGCAMAFGALGLVTWAALVHWLPVFFVPGQGGTTVRHCVLISGTAMFVFSAILLYTAQRAPRPSFTSWYSLALLLLAVGLFGVMIQLSLWSVVNWLSRIAQWLSGFYLLLAAIAALRESNQPLLPLGEKSRPALYRDVMAVVTVLVAAALRLVFLSALGTHAPFVVFYPAVMVAALYGGRRAGLVATALSAILADYFWIEPTGQLVLANPADWLGLVIFLLSGGMIAWGTDALLRARARAAAAESQALLAAQREAAVEALRESEAKYRDLFANMTEEVHFWKLVRDANGQIKTWTLVDANPPTLKTWGKTLAEIQGKTTDEIFGPGATEHYMPVVQKIMTEGVPFHFEDSFPNLDKYFRFTSVPLGDYFITTGTDITSIKKTEAALRENEEGLRLMVEEVKDYAIFMLDAEGRIATWNTGAQRLKGHAANEILGQHFSRFYPPEDVAAGKPQRELTAVAEQGYFAEEGWRVRKDGSRFWAAVTITALRDEAGRLRGFAKVTRDMTERKRADEALRESEQRVRRKLESLLSPEGHPHNLELGDIIDAQAIQSLVEDFYKLAGIPVFVLDLNGTVLVGVGWQDICTRFHRANSQTCKHCIESDLQLTTGVPAGQFKIYKCRNGMWDIVTPILVGGHHMGNLYSGQFFFEDEPVDRERFRAQARQYGFDEQDYLAALDRVPRLSRDFVDRGMAFLLKLADVLSKLSYSNIKLARSLAERDTFAEELSRSNKDLEQFAYVASHDLQEPLRMVAGYVDLLKERYQGRLDDKADKYIAYAVDGAARMSTLIRDLLAYSRVNTRGEELQPFDSKIALDFALRSLTTAITKSDAAITHDPLPIVRADKTQLGQLFQNLIGNAVKFRSPDRPPQVHISVSEDEGHWLFSVRDNGIGFKQEYEDKLFLVFQRLHSRGKYPGTGIGLAICKRIVERHRGRIWAASEPGQGSTFSFTIPK